MKRYKKLPICILAFCMMCLFSVSAIAKDSKDDYTYQNKLHVLEKLEIINESFNDEDILTRGEAASFIANMGRNMYPIVNSDTAYYYDVDSQNKNLDAINTLRENNIMNGYDNNLFKPDEEISCGDFIIVILRMGGFSELADMNGGYPNGYAQYITKVSNGIPSSSSITYKQCVEIMYEILELEIPTIDYSDGKPNVQVNSDYTMLEYLFELQKYRGTVVANNYIALDGRKRTGDDHVLIKPKNGRETTYMTDEDTEAYMGIDVDYYIDSDEENVICFYPRTKAISITIQHEDINEVDTGITEVEYLSGNGSTKTLKLIKDANFVYNGTSTYNISADNLTKHDGYTEFIDTDGDNKYDLVKVWNYKTYFVGNVSVSSNAISDVNTGSTVILDNEDSDYDLKIKKLGVEIPFDMIEQYNVVSVAESNEDTGTKVITAEVSDNVVEGNVTRITEDSIFIDDTEYEIAVDFDSTAVSMNLKGKFGLNFRNKLVCVYTSTMDGVQYGYLMNAWTEKPDDIAGLKLMNSASEIVKLNTAITFYLNDEKATPEKLMRVLSNDSGIKQQIISFKLDDDGNLKKIYYATDDNAGIIEQGDKYELVCNRSFEGDIRFLLPQGVVDGEYYMKSDMPVFRMITDKNGKIIEEMSGIVNYRSLGAENGYKFKMKLYDADQKHEPAIGLLTYKADEWMNYYKITNHAVAITYAGPVVNEDGELVNAIRGYLNGLEVEYYIDESITPASNFKAGDLCFVFVNGKYIVKSITLFRQHCDVFTDQILFGDYEYTADKPGVLGDNNDAYGKSSITSCSVGTITNIFDNGMLFTPAGTSEVRRYEISNPIAVYEKARKNVYTLKAQTDLGPHNGKCMIFTRYGIVCDVVILGD